MPTTIDSTFLVDDNDPCHSFVGLDTLQSFFNLRLLGRVHRTV